MRVRKHLGVTQREMSDLLGAGRNTWQNYERGGQVPGGKIITALIEKGINANWILTGKGEMLMVDDLQKAADKKQAVKNGGIPPAGMVKAFALRETGRPGWFVKLATSLITPKPFEAPEAKDLFALITEDTSLTPYGIDPKNLIFCSAETAPQNGNLVFVERVDSLAATGMYWEGDTKGDVSLETYAPSVDGLPQEVITLEIPAKMISKVSLITHIKPSL
ncbi:hypothetical protein X474_05575 [Dethiosulfatarculus sandiegensis]|uniref:HTH cro/C1-type domain-containing protein n=2 Tax=Dethiosulfatarculus sandiegensis TaxID=1429043 RepID=A0A0D2GJW4_9BACT|nr:hypothetical protein X474_05575 [Dethiosulfatarculus sandiegensis]